MSRSRQRDVNVDGALPRNQARGCAGMRVHHDERVHPAPMGGADEEVAARRQVLLARGPDPEPEDDEEDEPGDQPEEAIRGATPSLPVAGRARRGPRPRRPARRRGPPARPDPAAGAGGREPGAAAMSGAGRSVAGRGLGRLVGRGLGRLVGASGVVVGRAVVVGRVVVASVVGRRRRRRRPRPRRRPRSSSSSYSSSSSSYVVVVLVVIRHRAARWRPTSRPRDASRGSSIGWPGRWRQRRISPAATMNRTRHDLGGRDAEERPVVRAEGLEDEPDDAVPDEEDQQQVARPQALPGVEPEPDRTSSARAPPTATRTGTAGGSGSSPAGRRRCTKVAPRSGGRNRSGSPTAASSACRTAPG